MSEIKARLNAAFAEIRKAGLFAQQNFMCCSGCALADAAIKCCVPGRKERGVVYYTQQDNDALREVGKCYIRFASFNREKDLSIGDIADVVTTALARQAIQIEWDGNTAHAILAFLPEAA
jgi:hypothetical protein